MPQWTGYPTVTLERRLYLQILYDRLLDKSKVREYSHVDCIIEEAGTVRVLLKDRSECVGDLVVGADGVHSSVRKSILRAVNISAFKSKFMTMDYRCLLASGPTPKSLTHNDLHLVSNNKFYLLLGCQADKTFLFACCKLSRREETDGSNYSKCSNSDLEALIARLASYPISKTESFGDFWKTREEAELVFLEEGMLERLTAGRMVLVGDSAHKISPSAGLGGALAMEDAVALANRIRQAVLAFPLNKLPSDEALRFRMRLYQDSRLQRVKDMSDISWVTMRLQACDGWLLHIAQRWLVPIIGMELIAKQTARIFCESVKLDYVDFEERQGNMGWERRHFTYKLIVTAVRLLRRLS